MYGKTIWISGLALAAAGCGGLQKTKSDRKNPNAAGRLEPIKDVILVGTKVDEAEFARDQSFTLVAVPKAESGKAILSPDVETGVTIDSQRDAADAPETRVATIAATPDAGVVQPAATNELAIALDIDASGSMTTNDPDRLRVSGAKAFFDVIAESVTKRPHATAVFGFGRFEATPPTFDQSVLLQDFTDDVAALGKAADKITASTGTPTYDSLLEVLAYLDRTKPAGTAERQILIFSDGQPDGGSHTEKEVCADAKQRGIPIYTIGLGPASDVGSSVGEDRLTRQQASKMMRNLANCSGGTYAGVKPPAPTGSGPAGAADAASIKAIYTAMATAATDGSVAIKVTLSGEGLAKLEAGTILSGTLTLGAGGHQSSATFSFSVPAKVGAASSAQQTSP